MDRIKELLGEDFFKQMAEKLGETKLMINDGTMIPKDKFNEVNEAKKTLTKQVDELKAELETKLNKQKTEYETQLTEVNTKLKEFEPFAKDNEELKTKLTELSDSNTKKIGELEQSRQKEKEDYDKQIKQQAFDFELDKSLSSSGAKNNKAVKALLDLEKISMDDNKNLLGFNDQIETLKKSDGDFFGEKKIEGFPPGDGDDSHAGFFTQDQVKKMAQDDVNKNLDAITKSMEKW